MSDKLEDKLTRLKDWIYILCTLFQTILALVAFILANVFWKMKERSDGRVRDSKEERETGEKLAREGRERQERLDREEREKIADLFSREYNAIEPKVEEMKKTISSLQSTPIIVYKDRTVFALDVLRYMCQPDHRNDCDNQELKIFCSDVDDIVNLFRNFRIKLPPTALGRRQCPENIKEELGPSIIEIGTLVFPFISSRRQKTVTEVLAYFGATTPSNGADIGNLREEIPYVNNFRLEKDGKISFHTTSMVWRGSHVISIANLIEKKQITNFEDIVEKMKTFWVSCSATSSRAPLPDLDFLEPTNMLHLMRMTLNKLCTEKCLLGDTEAKNLMEYLKQLRSDPSVLTDTATTFICQKLIDDISRRVRGLEKFQELLQQKETAEFLEKLARDCDVFIGRNQRFFH